MSSEIALRQPAKASDPAIPAGANAAGKTESVATDSGNRQSARTGRQPTRRLSSALTTLSAHGAPLVWLTGGALATALAMIIGLLALVLYHGLQTFWPLPLREFQVLTEDAGVPPKTFLGEVTRSEWYRPEPSQLEELQQRSPVLFAKAEAEMKANGGRLRRQLIWTGRTGALDFAGNRAVWINNYAIESETAPEWAVVVERLDGGRSYGTPQQMTVDGKLATGEPQQIWRKFAQSHGPVAARRDKIGWLDRYDRGAVDRRQRSARLSLVSAQLDLREAERTPSNQSAIQRAKATVAARQADANQVDRAAAEQKEQINQQIKQLEAENERFQMQLKTTSGEALDLPLANIVRAYPANQLSVLGKSGVYGSRWWEFLTADPRESNTEGGVFPAIWGTVAMTLIMSVLVVPFGVLAALYLREYAKAGAIVSAIRISINNLAGVPSIVFGVFGLGLFCYVIGASIDQIFFRAALSEGTPTFGTGGILWASLTLALLTLPVVIVATEEALAAVPNSMREGSYACGASKWQTIRRIVLPRALPGIMTGMILAMARGAGEVAPLMLVGVKDLAPALPVDSVFPFVHPQRSFMVLAYQIFTVGFKSPNAEAAKPMVFTTTLLLIAIVAFLNVAAVYFRSRLRRRFVLTQF